MTTRKVDLVTTGIFQVYELSAENDADVEDIAISHGFVFASDEEANAKLWTNLVPMHPSFYDAGWYIKSVTASQVTVGKGGTDAGCAASGATTARLEFGYHSMFE